VYVFEDIEALERAVGGETLDSPWITVTQQMIDEFADVTGDRQWIHIDPIRAATESPFGKTIAHGFLTVSLLSHMIGQTMRVSKAALSLNYGFDRLRFVSPVVVDSEIRGTFGVAQVSRTADGVQVAWNVEVRARDAVKPALAATWLSRIVA
jgi:acyl dehydratase